MPKALPSFHERNMCTDFHAAKRRFPSQGRAAPGLRHGGCTDSGMLATRATPRTAARLSSSFIIGEKARRSRPEPGASREEASTMNRNRKEARRKQVLPV